MAFCVRLARSLVYLLGDQEQGRLRLPHRPAAAAPSAGPSAALSDRGRRDLLRAPRPELGARGLIKARTIAGDSARRAALLKSLAPFVWRTHLDYAAIRDIHSIKRQINAYRGFGTIQRARPRPQGRPRRHPRDRVLRPDPAADPGRARARHCARRRPAARWRRWPSAAGSRTLRPSELTPGLPRPARARASPADGGRPADPGPARARAGFREVRRLRRVRRRRPSWSGWCCDTLLTVERHYAALFEQRARSRRPAPIWCSPAPATIRRR